ncbi:MAG TPA: M43 family zinc metalloprotease, partial [Flavobacteriales bacterium]|nr:M43 family zinc metalloprotease [Flavobacteriales bacterium]
MHVLRAAFIVIGLAVVARSLAQCEVRIPPGAPTWLNAVQREGERGGAPLYVVPTVVHVYYGGDLLPIGILQVQDWLAQCNADLRGWSEQIGDVVPEFAGIVGDMNVELRLATRDEQGDCMSGIRYHAYDPGQGNPPVLENTLDTRHYLNIHVAGGQSFATLPAPVTDPYDANDVIMITPSQASLEGHTLAHEVGHWCGLYHVWGTSPTTGDCGNDYIADTPTTDGSQLDCILDQSECAPPIVENVQNFMDYSSCRIMFTQG